MKPALRPAVWTLVIFLAVLFVIQGLSKFAGPSSTHWAARFASWGYPQVLRYLVGTIEILGGIGLLVPRASRAAAVALMFVMAGACYTHVTHGEVRHLIPPLVLGTLALLIFIWRRPSHSNQSSQDSCSHGRPQSV